MLALEFGRLIALTNRYIVIVWLIRVLDEIRKYALEAFDSGIEALSNDNGSFPVKPHSKENGFASGMSSPMDHTVGNGDTEIGSLLPERIPPTLLDHPAPTTNLVSTCRGTHPLPTGYDASERSITSLKARLRELEW